MKNKVHIHFSRAADSYDTHATVQHLCGEALISLLPTKMYSAILDLGCGTGFTTKKLLTHLKPLRGEALDFSADLLSKAKTKLSPFSINLIKANFDEHLGNGEPDLVFSNMAIHWSENLPKLTQSIYYTLNHGGVFAFSIPLTHTFHEIQSSVSVKRFLNAETVLYYLNQAGFRLLHHHIKDYMTDHSNLHDALRAIQKTGANTAPKQTTSRLTRGQLLANPLTLTYNIGFFIVEKSNAQS